MQTNIISWFFYNHPLEMAKTAKAAISRISQTFSLSYLPKHLFDPWHRDIQGYGRGFDIQRILTVLGWNLVSRFLGALVRLAVLFVGSVTILATLVVTGVFILLWYTFPLLLILFTASALKLL